MADWKHNAVDLCLRKLSKVPSKEMLDRWTQRPPYKVRSVMQVDPHIKFPLIKMEGQEPADEINPI